MQAWRLFPSPSAEDSSSVLANARIDIHVHVDGLICDNAERLRFRADTLRRTPFRIEDIVARRQCEPIMPFPICGHRSDLFLSVLAQNKQRIFGVGVGLG